MFHLIRSLAEYIRRGSAHSSSVRPLSEFDERLLDDIGITREQAREIDARSRSAAKFDQPKAHG